MIDFVKQITQEAGRIILTSPRTIRAEKEGGGNWVTESDVASERYLMNAIHKKYPSHSILAEETQSGVPHPEQEDSLWVIDPLDGTTNFKYHLPFFAVSVAFVERGVTQCGAIYDPSRDELFWAERGKGAYLRDEKISVDQATAFSGTLVDVGSPYVSENFEKTYPLGTAFHAQGARIVNFGSAALECAYVACGRLSLYYEVGLKPWDVAAGALLIEEAGGKVLSEGNTFTPFHFERFFAGNPSLIKKAQNILQT